MREKHQGEVTKRHNSPPQHEQQTVGSSQRSSLLCVAALAAPHIQIKLMRFLFIVNWENFSSSLPLAASGRSRLWRSRARARVGKKLFLWHFRIIKYNSFFACLTFIHAFSWWCWLDSHERAAPRVLFSSTSKMMSGCRIFQLIISGRSSSFFYLECVISCCLEADSLWNSCDSRWLELIEYLDLIARHSCLSLMLWSSSHREWSSWYVCCDATWLDRIPISPSLSTLL